MEIITYTELNIDRGKYHGIKRKEGFSENVIENEVHFLFHCPLYDESRKIFLTKHSQGRNQMINLFKNDNVALLVDLA